MVKKIFLNGQEIHFADGDLPILIHGKEHIGASLFTVSLLANLYSQGSGILFLSGYHMAKDEFLKQVEGDQERVIFIQKEDQKLFLKLIQTLPDINERIILIKNIELFPQDIFNAIKDKNKIIIAGDIDKCSFKKEIIAKKYQIKIIFSQPETDLGIFLPKLKRYEGHFLSNDKKGTVFVQIKL